MNQQFGVVVVAAGKGSRMGSTESKQYLLMDHKPILVHTLEVFQNIAEVSSIVLVIGAGDESRCEQYTEQYKLTKVSQILSGGSERQASVLKGLRALPLDTNWVLVHDGVRPFVTRRDVLACWQQAIQEGAAVLAVPVKDTIKVVDYAGYIESTPNRRSLWAIQTPQAFRLGDLINAHEQAEADEFIGTDDAMLLERLGSKVAIVEGSYTNIKITTPEDLTWAEFSIQRDKGENK
ncbi:2-C-methyl-D-erythritol 4-phosphate cytidylyltransferase [Paenibacillus psychroresistens]|uniref:2-C-methyl-D-erythritol 4-phosphate cytidylyltransferase n=1 Tax=Paenibacillus psychroresistens TaxID=1778678 RepID=A0A6B8RDG9_9BACL|nr:2-C-methyl-D-erythritol 4-phosphate cytidylyltransferase [Paenibacillus psychroresistens]QGQ93593.1 2-C-methyl-D-erythritol 4-phosphate cytidylyltransferase [Paenibacillus psychroresistens]